MIFLTTCTLYGIQSISSDGLFLLPQSNNFVCFLVDKFYAANAVVCNKWRTQCLRNGCASDATYCIEYFLSDFITFFSFLPAMLIPPFLTLPFRGSPRIFLTRKAACFHETSVRFYLTNTVSRCGSAYSPPWERQISRNACCSSKIYAKTGVIFPTNCGTWKERILYITDDYDYWTFWTTNILSTITAPSYYV